MLQDREGQQVPAVSFRVRENRRGVFAPGRLCPDLLVDTGQRNCLSARLQKCDSLLSRNRAVRRHPTEFKYDAIAAIRIANPTPERHAI